MWIKFLKPLDIYYSNMVDLYILLFSHDMLLVSVTSLKKENKKKKST